LWIFYQTAVKCSTSYKFYKDESNSKSRQHIQLEEVFNSIVLKTTDGEEMAICMRDSGFEFKYQGEWYFAKEGYVEPFHKSVRGNYLVEQKHDGSVDCLPQTNSEQS
jgi:hypothetical protein